MSGKKKLIFDVKAAKKKLLAERETRKAARREHGRSLVEGKQTSGATK